MEDSEKNWNYHATMVSMDKGSKNLGQKVHMIQPSILRHLSQHVVENVVLMAFFPLRHVLQRLSSRMRLEDMVDKLASGTLSTFVQPKTRDHGRMIRSPDTGDEKTLAGYGHLMKERRERKTGTKLEGDRRSGKEDKKVGENEEMKVREGKHENVRNE